MLRNNETVTVFAVYSTLLYHISSINDLIDPSFRALKQYNEKYEISYSYLHHTSSNIECAFGIMSHIPKITYDSNDAKYLTINMERWRLSF